MLISPALAQAGAAPAPDLFGFLMPMVLIFVVFYFLLIRPQQQRVKQHRAMVDNLKRGDQVVTGGGIFGKVTRVEAGDATLLVEIAPNVQVKVARSTITDVTGKPPVSTSNDNRVDTAAAGGTFASRLQRFFRR
jgi:preprotein translocase subunit YajC